MMQASKITSYLFIGMVIGYLAWGWLTQVLERRKLPMLLGALLSLVVVAGIMFIPGDANWYIFLFFALGFTQSSQTIAYPLVGEINPMNINSTAISIVSMNSLFWGGVIAQPFFAFLMDVYNHSKGLNVDNAQSYQFTMFILIFACLLALFFAFMVKETYCKRQVH